MNDELKPRGPHFRPEEPSTTPPQPEQWRNLVFEGGGVKGIAYAGALQVLEERGLLAPLRNVAGTSAGAITSTLVALGYTASEITEIVGDTSFRKFMDDSWGVARDAHRLLDRYGWYKGDAFARWIRDQIGRKTGDPDSTFMDLAALGGPSLHVIGTNVTYQREEVFSRTNSPHTPVWLAVRISMSIPLYFAAVRHKGIVYVDGGVSWNYPIDLFDAAGPNPATLGMRVDTRDEIRTLRGQMEESPHKIENFLDYAKVLVGHILEMGNKVHLKTDDWHRTVFIDAGGVRATDFDLSDERVQDLIERGRAGALEYLAWFDDPASEPVNRVRL